MKQKNNNSTSTNRIPKEYEEQKMLVIYLQTLKEEGKIIEYHSIPNENLLSFLDRKLFITAQQKLKSLGAKKGVPDIFVYLPNKLLMIELKRRKKSLSKISKEQEYFNKLFNKLSFVTAYIAYGFEDAKSFIEKQIIY